MCPLFIGFNKSSSYKIALQCLHYLPRPYKHTSQADTLWLQIAFSQTKQSSTTAFPCVVLSQCCSTSPWTTSDRTPCSTSSCGRAFSWVRVSRCVCTARSGTLRYTALGPGYVLHLHEYCWYRGGQKEPFHDLTSACFIHLFYIWMMLIPLFKDSFTFYDTGLAF